LAEARAANLVRHEGVVTVLDDGEDADGRPFLVMELLHGETLATRLMRDGPQPAIDVIAWGVSVLEILAAAHERNVIHRDVKPSNIFVTQRGEIKLLDFGVARILSDAADAEWVTREGASIGTPAFMAPEQAAGATSEIGPVTDVWGCGATLFQLLTGRPVHGAENEGHQLASAATMAAPPVAAFCPQLPTALGRVVDRALHFRASDRWPSALAMRQALVPAREQALLAGSASLDTLTEEGEAVVGSAPIAARRRRLIAPSVTVLALLLGCAAFFNRRAASSDASAVVPTPSVLPARSPSATLPASASAVPGNSAVPFGTTSPEPSGAPLDKQRRAAPHAVKSLASPKPPPSTTKPVVEVDEATRVEAVLDRRK